MATATRTRKAPAKKAAPKEAAEKPAAEVKGSAWLRDHVNETLGTTHESTRIRAVLRKLVADGEIEAREGGRYDFSGPRDPIVKAVIAALKAEAKTPTKRGRKPKAAKAEVETIEEVEEEVEDLDLD
ncbi:hypothetical protein FF47_33 [Mycobacterium phage FF47]|uniref:Uncharacterized protein n=2 Tax=Mapvirus Ff47 TaxID=1920751 RepID=A0A899INA4_9CAUD|nr:hypothetical protein FF47_33 [Mycobacterium phage FF47]AGI12301.1 hypothetical protein FF47_33 [Mycobacterium phage FF47]QSL99642.1 hypothetical protein [Mycobacterium phage Maco2]QXN76715.1 hypothetical protein [Mycobacterium phage Maco7]WKV22154.1 hypothetical protein 8UZL_00036 [Mycobacteroides phage 8UZL]